MRNADPNDVEVQKMIEAEIRQQMINQEYQMSLENNPDYFGKISMLWIETIINGYPVQALVDSGAERTIISQKLAE